LFLIDLSRANVYRHDPLFLLLFADIPTSDRSRSRESRSVCKIEGVPATTCHRCSAAVAPGCAFCPECGAPQLRVLPAEEAQGIDLQATADYGRAQHAQSVRWHSVFPVAAIIALPVGLLCSFLAFSTLWAMAGAVWTVAIYRRRVPGRLSSGTGSRIGIVLGVFAAFISTATDAASMLVDRYGLHKGAEIDGRLHTAVQAYVDAMISSNPSAAAQLPWFFHFWLSPDGHAAYLLMLTASSAALMLGFAALGGALGARYYGRRARSA
jgi:hypothetical protein